MTGNGRADVTIIVSVDMANNQRVPGDAPDERATRSEPPPRPPLVVIAGPTGVGKTALGVELARRFNGEVVSADSRYLYRGLDIGVAKPDVVERRGVPHHLIDVVPRHGHITLVTFQDLALAAISGTLARGHLPFLVGGTPLYVNAVVEGWRIPRVAPNPALRAALETEATERGLPALAARLRAVDPVAAVSASHPETVVHPEETR